MSLKKQIQRNIERKTKAEIKKYEPFLKPDWESRPMSDLNVFANLARNGITVEYLNGEIERARKQAFEDTSVAIMKAVYASAVLTLHEEFGFSNDDCLKALVAIDNRMAFTIDSEEIVKEMEEKVGIRFNANNGVERIQQL